MEFHFFTEMPYPYIPDDYYERYGSARVIFPNHLLDPQKISDLYKKYLDLYEYADEKGLNLKINEHHQTITCLNSAISVSASALIQRTKRARITLLGYPIPHKYNPLQVAEEVAMLDTMSGGRIDVGFVRGVGQEIHPANTKPIDNRERFYEAHDLIIKAWKTGTPFSWESKHYQFRYVNTFPQPYQRPHPPIWTTGATNVENIQWAAEKGYVYSTLFSGFEGAAKVFDIYRAHRRNIGLPEAAPDRFSYSCLLYVAETDEIAEREGRQLMWYLETKEPHWFRNPPGFSPVEERKRLYQPNRGGVRSRREKNWEELKRDGLIIVGSPDTVAKRIKDYYDLTGASHLSGMMHAGPMSEGLVRKNIRLFTEEVLPQVEHLGEDLNRDMPQTIKNGK